MNNQYTFAQELKTQLEKLKLNIFLLLTVFTSLLVASFIWNYIEADNHIVELAKLEARTNINKDRSFRQWAASHGGVYVSVDKDTPPNPYLADIPDRDINSSSGKNLTLMNPAYMIRQVMEKHEKLYGIKGRIVGIKHFRPETAADEWESRAIGKFEQGSKEISEFVSIKDKQYLRVMEPFYVEQSCLKCHGHQGYKIGDVRGGIGVIVPMERYIAQKNSSIYNLLISHIVIWLFGMLAAIIGYRYGKKSILLKIEQEKEIIAANLKKEYMDGLLHIVADVDRQIILTAESEAEMINEACKRISQFFAYSGACITAPADNILYVAALAVNGIVAVEDGILKKIRIPCVHPAEQTLRQNSIYRKDKSEMDDDFIEFVSSMGIAFEKFICLPLRHKKSAEPIGVLTVYSQSKNNFTDAEVAMLEGLAGNIGFAVFSIKQRTKNRELEILRTKNYEETIHTFVGMIEQRDTYTAGHTVRVAKYCELIARTMNIDDNEIERLTRAAILHDIGKLVTPDSILLKPYKLEPLEYRLIQEHVSAGFQMLAEIDMYKELANIIVYHHERFDGRGYPFGIKGDDIPLLSSIMCVADAFDAMTTNRVYKPRMSKEEALTELKELSGIQFSPIVVNAALVALNDVDIPKETTQLPKTELEKERFVYFFKDPLTGVYNSSYLQLLKSSSDEVLKYKITVMFYLRNFSAFNKQHGWESGNEMLKQVSRLLSEIFIDGLVFRIKGDDFLVLLKSDDDLDGRLNLIKNKTEESLGNTRVEVKIGHFDMKSGEDSFS